MIQFDFFVQTIIDYWNNIFFVVSTLKKFTANFKKHFKIKFPNDPFLNYTDYESINSDKAAEIECKRRVSRTFKHILSFFFLATVSKFVPKRKTFKECISHTKETLKNDKSVEKKRKQKQALDREKKAIERENEALDKQAERLKKKKRKQKGKQRPGRRKY